MCGQSLLLKVGYVTINFILASSMKRIFFVTIAFLFMMPTLGICTPDEDQRAENAIKELQNYKSEHLVLTSITKVENQVRVEGYADSIQDITSLRNSIGNWIGYSQVLEIMPEERVGRHVKHFVIEIEPFLKPVPHLEDANSFVQVYSLPDQPWFANLVFHPSGKEIRGIPIKHLNANWCAANELESGLFPPSTYKGNDGLDSLLKYGWSFSITEKFDGVRSMTALVGVYETCERKSGSFLAVLDNTNHSVAYFEQYEHPPILFTRLLRIDSHSFSVWDCFLCETITVLEWDKTARKFVAKQAAPFD